MAGISIFVSALVLLSSTLTADASTFLHAKARAVSQLAATEVEEALLSELSGQNDAARLRLIEIELYPMYAALPKGEGGRLAPSTVRYALHRYFVQKHGWYVNGLDPAGGTWTSQAPTSVMKDRAPAYIQGLFDVRLHGQGLGLHDLAVFAATLSDLIHKEAVGTLVGVYSALEYSTLGLQNQDEFDEVLKAYLVDYLIGGNVTGTSLQELHYMEDILNQAYPAWPDTLMWAQDFIQAFDLARRSRYNPFGTRSASLDEVVSAVQELGHHFGTFQNLECHSLKEKLLDMEYEGSGRVPLSRFYSGGLEGDFTFTESEEYLRNLGALDETDPQRPSVVIPNYLKSASNCLTSSSFYSVCCTDECEGLMGHLEQSVAAPHASPKRIAELVSDLTSDTVIEPRNLSMALLNRLDEIANHHGGHVPLHGRLFAQWMHHAYPRECPFPHASGTTSPVSPDEWMIQNGIAGLDASEKEMRAHVMSVQDDETMAPGGTDLPWVAVEELVASHQGIAPKAPSSVRTLLAFSLLGSCVMMLIRAYATALGGSAKKSDKCVV